MHVFELRVAVGFDRLFPVEVLDAVDYVRELGENSVLVEFADAPEIVDLNLVRFDVEVKVLWAENAEAAALFLDHLDDVENLACPEFYEFV